MGEPDEDEWEYEYDDNETEDFYIPIDLANVPSVQGALGISGPTQKGNPRLLKTKLRALNAERREAESNLAVQHIEDADESIGNVQIIGLHTDNPLMMYNNQLLSCEWNKTIGTDLIFSKPTSATGQSDEPLRVLPSVDLLASGSARLVARVAQMRPKDDLFNDVPNPQEQEPSGMKENPSAVAEAELQPTTAVEATAARPAPSSFLERLNQIKAKRGESSRLGLANPPGGTRLVTFKEGTTTRPGGDIVMGGT
jgi:hypothetical protein